MAAKASARGVHTEDDQWRLRVRAWLIRHAGGLLLFDTGIGGASSPTQTWAPVTGDVAKELEAIGVDRRHIDTVAISHAHDDHIGGVLDDEGEPMFPNARYVIQQADRDWLRDLAPEDEESAACWELLRAARRRRHPRGDRRRPPHRHCARAPSSARPHPGHQILRIDADGRRLVLCADTWNHPAQFAHPDWPSGPDNHHAQAAASRRRLLAELLSHPGTVIAPTHLAESFGEVRSGRDGLAAWMQLD